MHAPSTQLVSIIDMLGQVKSEIADLQTYQDELLQQLCLLTPGDYLAMHFQLNVTVIDGARVLTVRGLS